MQIELIETFLDLCETSSFNQSAERLGVTQSTVSARIKTLETLLERRLFQRSRSGTSLTLEGIRFEPHARALRVGWSEALRATQDAGPTATTIRIGLQRDLTSMNIVDWVRDFRAVLPETGLYIEADFSVQMCEGLMRGTLDLALIYSPTPHPDLYFQSMNEVRFRMVSDVADTLRDVPPDSYVRAENSPALERMHNALLPHLANTPLACGQESLSEALLRAHGGSGYVLEATAKRLIAEHGFVYVAKAPTLPQPVYSAIHLRNRHRSSQRKLFQLMGQHFAQTTGQPTG